MTDRELYDLYGRWYRGDIPYGQYLAILAAADPPNRQFSNVLYMSLIWTIFRMVGATALLCIAVIVVHLSEGVALAFAAPAEWSAAAVFGFVLGYELTCCWRCKREMTEWWRDSARRRAAEQTAGEWWRRGEEQPEWSEDRENC